MSDINFDEIIDDILQIKSEMNIENINTKKTNVKKLLYLDDKKRENKKEYKADKIFEIKQYPPLNIKDLIFNKDFKRNKIVPVIPEEKSEELIKSQRLIEDLKNYEFVTVYQRDQLSSRDEIKSRNEIQKENQKIEKNGDKTDPEKSTDQGLVNHERNIINNRINNEIIIEYKEEEINSENSQYIENKSQYEFNDKKKEDIDYYEKNIESILI